MDLVRATGAPARILPELCDAAQGEPLGTLLDDIADETGLSPDTPVLAVSTHDTASAVLAAPIDPRRDLYVSSGTWSLVGAELAKPVLSAAARAGNFTNELGVFGSVRFLRNVAGLWLVQQLEASFEAAGRRRSWAELAALAEGSEALRSVVDPDDPSLFAPGNMAEHLAALCRARGEPVPESDAQLVRCALDSVALATARAARGIADAARTSAPGFEPARIVIVGGGAANALLNQLVADASALPVETGPAECTAIGNALAQHAAIEGIADARPLRDLVRGSCDARRFEPDFARAAAMRDAEQRLSR
jgi:rhamnulokinase